MTLKLNKLFRWNKNKNYLHDILFNDIQRLPHITFKEI